MMQWHMKAGIITNNIQGKMGLNLPEIIATNIVTWNFHVNDSAKDRYDMILGRDIIT